jgi:erythromycin esterase
MSSYPYIALLALVAILSSCHPEVIAPSSRPPPHGSIREPAGGPSPGTWVTVTDRKTAQQVAVVQTDRAGEFVLEVPPGDYAFAATSVTGFAFVEKRINSAEGLEIALSPRCHLVRGQVTGTVAGPAVLRVARDSAETGDRFFATVGANGQIAACLPAGSYWAYLKGAVISLSAAVHVPAVTTIPLIGYSMAQITRPPGDLHIESTDLGSFARALHGRQVVGLGEANHGTGDFYSSRAQLSLELARTGKLRCILLEADAIKMFAIDDYVMGVDVDIMKSVAALEFWTTDNHEFLHVLADLRAYNAAAPGAGKIHVLGIDAQSMKWPVALLLERRRELEISAPEADLLSRIAPDDGKAFTSLSSDERTMLLSVLDRLAAPSRAVDVAAVAIRASIAARSVRYQLGYLDDVGGAGSAMHRDRAMAELTAYIGSLPGSGQVAVWAHDGHLAREAAFAEKSLGQYLAEKFGDSYYPIAFLSYRGTARAWDAGGQIGVIPHELTATPPYNVESAIMHATKFVDTAWVRLDNADGALKQWLSMPRYVREFGAAYDPQTTQMLRAFPAAFSAVVVILQATATTPTPTGVRMIAK